MSFICLSSCTAKDQGYFLRRGEEVKLQLIAELKEANTLQDLFERQESLTALFDELARLAIEAHRYQAASKTTWGIPDSASVSSHTLALEMRRILAIPGSRALLEKCQSRAIERMDMRLPR